MLSEHELNALAKLRDKSALSTSAVIRKLILDERIKERPHADFKRLTDEINENLYDTFGDTVLETDETGAPVLIEDYIEDLKGMLET